MAQFSCVHAYKLAALIAIYTYIASFNNTYLVGHNTAGK